MGGFGSGRHAYGGKRQRLSGFPGEGETDLAGVAPWLRFSARDLKSIGACGPGSEAWMVFAGEVLKEVDCTEQDELEWPRDMYQDYERARALYNASELCGRNGNPCLWIRLYCFRYTDSEEQCVSDEDEVTEQNRYDGLCSLALSKEDSLLEIRVWLPRLPLVCDARGREAPGLSIAEPQPLSFSLMVEKLPCHFGGFKCFLLCPLCQKRVSFLYLERSCLQLN